MSNHPMRVGVIGCGSISPVHFHAISHIPQAQLVAVCDILEDRARAKSEAYGVAFTTRWQEFLDYEPSLEVVHLCTPHGLHAEMAIALLERGIHVLCEKPMATTLLDARRMLDAQTRAGVSLGIIFQNRYNPGFLAVKECVTTGQMGKLMGGRLNFTWGRDESYYQSADWKGTWNLEGGGVLINQAIHSIDQFLCLMGEVESLKAYIALWNNEIIEVEDTGVALMKFRAGHTGTLHCSNALKPSWVPNKITLAMEKGFVTLMGDYAIFFPNDQPATIRQISAAPSIGKVDWGDSHALQIADFYVSVSQGTTPQVDGTTAIRAIEVLRAIFLSHRRGGAEVDFPFEDDNGFPELPRAHKL